jgi:4-amino-4-deoxy-L-arabinose transferase-like glycosyltransferase
MRIKKFLKNYYLLILILGLAAFLRFYQITNVPPSTQWDETAIGYNAYSILKTGRDEYGKLLPLVFKSFGDYKPGLYIYLTVPSVAIFGLNELAVRFPSALAGIASVWLIYQVSWLLFKKKALSLFISFSLAMSPWAIHFSRGGWEANMVLFLTLLGIFYFLKSEKKPKYLYPSAITFGLSLLAYQGSKVFVPLLLLGLLIFFLKKIKTFPLKNLIISLVLFFLVASPAFLAVLTGGGGRLKTMSLFSYQRSVAEVKNILNADEGNLIYFNLFHTEGLSFATRLAERYFNHFSTRFLFFEGDWSSLRHGPPYSGVLYLFDFLLMVTGGYFLIRLNTHQSKFIWFWLLVAPIPAVLTRDSIQGVRSLNMVLPLMILIGCGFYQMFLWLSKQKKIFCLSYSLILAIFYLFSVAYFLDQYFYHYPLQSSKDWQYGYKQAVQRVYPLKDNYQKIIFTSEYGQPYIYWLFYGQYPPAAYQAKAQLTESLSGDVGKVEKLDNLEFRSISFDGDKNLSKSLLIGTELEIPLGKIDYSKQKVLEEIKFLNGKIAFRIVEIL